MPENPLQRLTALGQSVWLDYVRRSMVASGELARLMREEAIRGVTSNPSIFEKAIDGSSDYDAAIAAAARTASPAQVYDDLTLTDIAGAADVLRPLYDSSEGRDGFVSIEVSPGLADDTEGSVAEARRIWGRLKRPNVMIKIPGTEAGYPAVRRLLTAGVNVNVTLMFSLGHYEAVAEAYLSALEARVARGEPVDRIASVASFFVSRVDTKVDPRVQQAARTDLCGKIAVANAQMAYARFREVFSGPRWAALAAKGARVQRPLWASTSTKNPEYSDVLYVEELVGPDTVNTVPPQTLEAYRDHGQPQVRVDRGRPAQRIAELPQLGIDLEQVAAELQREGVKAFADAYDKAVESVARKRAALSTAGGRR